MTTEHTPTLERIRSAAEAEFLKYGFRSASLRRIVRSVGMTTGAFYGYYKSKEELFEALVGEHYALCARPLSRSAGGVCRLSRMSGSRRIWAKFPARVCSICSAMPTNIWNEFKLILCCSEGTKFSGLIDEMVEIEAEATHAYQQVLEELGSAFTADRSRAGAYPDYRYVPHLF